MGIALYGQREIAYVQNERKKRSLLFFEIFILRFITMIFSIILFYFTFVQGTEYQLFYKILLIELIATILDISWLFQGLENFKKIAIRSLIVKIISIVSIFVFVKTSNDLWKYVLIYSLSTLIGNVSLWIYTPNILNHVSFKELRVFKHLKPTIILFIPQMAIQVYTILDKTMIGIILKDMSEVAYYEQSQKVIKVLMTIVTSISTIMLPRIANLYSNSDRNRINDYMYKTFNFVFFLGIPIMIGVLVVSNNFVPFFFGSGYEKVVYNMMIISPIIILIGFSSVIGNQYLITTKKQKEYKISVFIGAIVNFFLNIVLIIFLKSYGAAIATVIAEASVTIVQLMFIRKDIKLKRIFELSKNYCIAGIVMLLVCLLINIFNMGNIYILILKLIFGVITYFIMLMILKDKFLFTMSKRFFNQLSIKI